MKHDKSFIENFIYKLERGQLSRKIAQQLEQVQELKAQNFILFSQRAF